MDLNTYLSQEASQVLFLQLLFKDAAPQVFLEIGACEGEDSIRYLNQFPEVNLFAFEPHPNNIKIIKRNFLLNSNPRFNLVELAISDQVGISKFYLSSGQPNHTEPSEGWDYGNKSSSLLAPSSLMEHFVPWLKFNNSIKVETTTLESLFEKYRWDWVDFLHMDVQGAELSVLRGGQHQLERIRCIWLEISFHEVYEGQSAPQEIDSLLTSKGFVKVLEKVDSGFGDRFYVNTRAFRITPS